jgi:hypothetical protein
MKKLSNIKLAVCCVFVFASFSLYAQFSLRSNGTGNYSETEDIFGNQSDENGYWIANESSNNLMDYSCNQIALTPCQINQVHSYIEAEELLINGEFEVPLGSVFDFIPYGM